MTKKNGIVFADW